MRGQRRETLSSLQICLRSTVSTFAGCEPCLVLSPSMPSSATPTLTYCAFLLARNWFRLRFQRRNRSRAQPGINPARIIYANPCKAASFVRHAAANNVGLTTFDNADELDKMKRYHPSCKLVIRILTDDSKSACQLGLKFGAPLDSVPACCSVLASLTSTSSVSVSTSVPAATTLTPSATLCSVRAVPSRWARKPATPSTCSMLVEDLATTTSRWSPTSSVPPLTATSPMRTLLPAERRLWQAQRLENHR